MPNWEGALNRISELDRWRADVTSEVAQLPATLRQLREAVADLSVVAKRLAESTEVIEQVNGLYRAGMAETGRRLEDASATLRRELRGAPQADAASKALESAAGELQRTFAAIAELNPLWPGRRPRDE